MSLVKKMKKSGYDMIESPIRNHKLLQLWVDKPFSKIDFYYEHIDHAFQSDVPLTPIEDNALAVLLLMESEFSGIKNY